MDIVMTAVRLALIVLLSIWVDLAVPPLSEAMGGAGEVEELFHGVPGRRSLRIVQELASPTPPLRARAVSAPAVERSRRVSSAATAPVAHARKIPPPEAGSATASDDH